MPERPVILLDALVVQPRPTGVGRSILDLLRALAAEPRGYDFVVACTNPEMFEFLAAAPEWRLLTCPAARGGIAKKTLFTQIELPRLARRMNARLLHGLHFVAPLAAPCPLLVTVCDIAFRLFPRTVEAPRRHYYRFFVPLSLRRAAGILTISASTAQDLAAAYPFAAEKTIVTPYATPSWVEGRTAGTTRTADAPFLFVGTLEPRKNLERILAAYRLFLAGWDGDAAAPDLVLVGGRGWNDSTLRESIQDLEDSGKLRLAGYCDNDRLWELYASARALLFPSLHEGFGLPILEAMAAGLPVVTADRGAMLEVAGDAALTVDPEDAGAIAGAMGRLVREPGLAADLAARGSARGREWTWVRTAETTLAAYGAHLA